MIATVIAFPLQIIVRLLADLVGPFALSLSPRRSIEAENLLVRRELALFEERGIRPGRVDAATRLSRYCRGCLIGVMRWLWCALKR